MMHFVSQDISISLTLNLTPYIVLLPCYHRLATVASGAASGKLLEYEVGGPRVSVQTAYGVEVEVKPTQCYVLFKRPSC